MTCGLKNILRVLCVSAVNIILLSCAKQGFPPGGPVDKTGPIVRSSFPEAGAVNVPVKVRPWILLNEYPQRTSVPGSIFISPAVIVDSIGFEPRVRGKRLEVRFLKPLPVNRTIVVTFGAGIKDQVGNPMDQPYVLAFSTGDSLDKASIFGYITGIDKPASVWVWAYPLDSLLIPPSQGGDRGGSIYPDPRKDKAPFASQPNEKGSFRLDFLPTGLFRVFAVQEVRADRLWESETEAIAFPTTDARAEVLDVLSSQAPPQLRLKMSMQDLTPPKLLGVESLHRQGMRLSFDEPVTVTGAHIEIQTKTAQSLSIISAYQNPADSSAVLLATAIQREGDNYLIRLDSLSDRSGNLGDSLVADLPASVNLDTLGPKLSRTVPATGATDVDPTAGIQVGFTEAVTLTDLPHAVHVTDSVGVEVLGTWKYPYPAIGILTPSAPLKGNASYKITVYGDSLRDVFGVVSPDSLSSITFRTLDPSTLGMISGKVTGVAPDLRLEADRLEKGGGSWATTIGSDGGYRLENLPSSDYRLWLYQDIDHNQQWSPGNLTSGGIAFAEPFAIVRDSIHVRSGWETEGVDFIWPSP